MDDRRTRDPSSRADRAPELVEESDRRVGPTGRLMGADGGHGERSDERPLTLLAGQPERLIAELRGTFGVAGMQRRLGEAPLGWQEQVEAFGMAAEGHRRKEMLLCLRTPAPRGADVPQRPLGHRVRAAPARVAERLAALSEGVVPVPGRPRDECLG